MLAPLPPVIFNALIVGFEVSCLSDAGVFGFGNASLAGFAAGAVSVGVGELVVCYALGIPLMLAIRRTSSCSADRKPRQRPQVIAARERAGGSFRCRHAAAHRLPAAAARPPAAAPAPLKIRCVSPGKPDGALFLRVF